MARDYKGWREKQARISRERSQEGREIGPLPKVAKPRRKAKCRGSLRAFCETYLAGRFPLPWSADHLKVIGQLERCAVEGGRFALATPRGYGKTTLCEATAIWALLYGMRSFVVLIGSTEELAEKILASIKVELETNDALLEDFPEVCWPIRCLEGSAVRARMQTIDGERTRLGWVGKGVVLPTVARSKASGAALRVVGLTGSVRGMRHTRADGSTIRPDFVLVDDPQTDESARSPAQNAERERIMSQAVLGLAGPKKQIAVICPCTVIAPGDLADRLLDRDRNPDWQGERSQLLKRFPSEEAMQLWEGEYLRLRRKGDREGATRYYRVLQPEMDKGAQVAWEELYLPWQASAIQFALDLFLMSPAVFWSEYQNEPQGEKIDGELPNLEPDDVAGKLNRLPRGTLPRGATRLTCGIDVQPAVLYWLVAGWCEDYGGAVVDYGAHPRQNRAYFSSTDARPSLEEAFPGTSAESARIYQGLAALVGELTARDWPREDGGDGGRLERVIVDANYGGPGGTCADAVYQFCRRSPHAALLLPSHGRGIGAKSLPVADWPRREGERRGRDWVLTSARQGKGRHLVLDTNSWKSFVAERLRTEAGAPGCLWLPGNRPHDHQLLADHLTAETRVATAGRGRRLEEWTIRPDRQGNNHWLDCLVLACVAASVQGLVWSPSGEVAPAQAGRKRVSHSERQREAREKRLAGVR